MLIYLISFVIPAEALTLGGITMIVYVLIFAAAVVGTICAITMGDGPYAMLWGIVALCFAFVTAEASDG